jgi:hypothetical protein
MRKRIAALLAVGATALSTVVAMATPAAAAPPWTITPGGPVDGTAPGTNLVVHDPMTGDITLACDSSSVHAVLDEGSSPDNQLGTIPQTPGIQFVHCLLAGFIEFTVTQVGDWTINGVSYDAGTGVTTGTIDGITANISGPGCEATVGGFVNGTYTNSTDILAVISDPTLHIDSVDPANNCSDLIHTGATAEFGGAYHLDPPQDISG